MNNLKKIMFSLAALVIAFGLVFSLSAFKGNSAKNTTMYYYFNSDQEADIDDPNNWTPIDEVDVPNASCDGADLSCVITFDTNDFSDLGELLEEYPSTDQLRENDHVVAEKTPIAPRL